MSPAEGQQAKLGNKYSSTQQSSWSLDLNNNLTRRHLFMNEGERASEPLLGGGQSPVSIDDSNRRFNYINVSLMEYCITTPPLFAAVLAAISPSASTSMIMLAYISTLFSYTTFITMLKFTSIKMTDSMEKKAVSTALCFVAILTSASSCSIMAEYGTRFGSTYAPDTLLSASVWILVISQAAVTVLMIGHHIFSSQVEQWVCMLCTLMNAFVKFIIPILVASSAVQSKFPGQTCSMWADVQGFPAV